MPATQAALEKAFKSTGFFRQKSAAIRAFCQELMDRHRGQVPKTLDEMTALSGVGRKTGNLVLGVIHGRPGVVVDTHVKRVSTRLGLTTNKDPDKIEQDLMAVLPKSRWLEFGDQLIWHGRRVCAARTPRCAECVLSQLCPSSTV
jgi:endonuclease III